MDIIWDTLSCYAHITCITNVSNVVFINAHVMQLAGWVYQHGIETAIKYA